ncbi:MAG: hypothetical protein ABSE73_06240, partial [Planctomycetota bacterium]
MVPRVALPWPLAGLVAFSLCACGIAGAATVPIVFVTPSGGEVYAVSQNQTVRLDPKTKYKSVKIELTTDGTNWTLLGTINNADKNAAKHNVLPFTVAGQASANCMIRATASTGKVTVTSFSSPFSISAASGAPPQGSITAGSGVIAPAAITSTAIAPQAVVTAALANGSVTTDILADGAVTNPKIADEAVTDTKVGSGAASPGMVLQSDGNGHAIWATVAGVAPNAGGSIIAALNDPSVAAGTLDAGVLKGTAAINVTGNAATATLASAVSPGGVTTAMLANDAVDLTAKVAGVLPIANGGTGAAQAAANTVFAGPPGGPAAAPSFRALAAADLPGGSNNYVQLAPGSVQADGGAGASVFINKTAGGNLLQLQKNAADAFVVDNTGNLAKVANITSTGTLTGNGSGLTNLNGANISSGTVPPARLPIAVGNPTPTLGVVYADNTTITVDGTGMLHVTAAGGAVALALAGGQVDATTNSSIFINKTGASGDLVQLQKGGTDKFVVDNSGNLTTVGTIPAASVTGNITGSAGNVTGTVAIANGGTGAATQQAALNALAGAVASGQYLRGNGANVVMSAIQAADIPSLAGTYFAQSGNAFGATAVLGTTDANGLNFVTGGGANNRIQITAAGAVTINALGAGLVHSAAGGLLSSSAVALGTDVSGVLPAANGGTGGLTADGVMLSGGAGAATATAVGATGTVLAGTGGAPAFTAIPAVTTLAATGGSVTVGTSLATTGTLVLKNNTNSNTTTVQPAAPAASSVNTIPDVGATGTFAMLEGTQTFSGVKTFTNTITGNISGTATGLSVALAVTSGGTGQNSYTTGDLLVGAAGNTLSKYSDVAAGSVLVSGGVGAAPAWSSAPSVTTLAATGANVTVGTSGIAGTTGTLVLKNNANTNTTTLTPVAPAASSVNTIPDVGATGTFAMLEGAQTFSGAKTFSSLITGNISGTATGLSATLAATSGGTGQSTYTTGDLLVGAAGNTLNKYPDAAAGSVLVSGGVGAAPSWSNTPSVTTLAATGANVTVGTSGVAGTTGTLVLRNSTNNNTTTLTPAAPAASAVNTIPDVGATGTFAMLEGVQTFSGTKTFSSPITGSISGTASNVTGTVAVGNGGTGTTAPPTAAQILVSSGAGGPYAPVSMSGDATIASGGGVTVGSIHGATVPVAGAL